ncbi:hypothetical protein AVEN_106200-1 [Araneus ventricosus]|uniref:Uncharacterized protein n=1 Tax=Araneus ventricosus TaxID=182803 RepID=A0A4Y2QTK7_ARAVE|nr:hypothetical protein AVEN_232199-1 [Araneus ventricosus]GBN66670.1 hypothetical protein AVEN_106200-1 [Araneus ventricosus]
MEPQSGVGTLPADLPGQESKGLSPQYNRSIEDHTNGCTTGPHRPDASPHKDAGRSSAYTDHTTKTGHPDWQQDIQISRTGGKKHQAGRGTQALS